MKTMSKISKEFSAALDLLLTKKNYGTAVKLAENVDTTDKYISQIRNGHRDASPGLQERIAEEMGFSHNDFVTLGRMLIDGVPKKEVEQKASVLRKRPDTHRVEKSFNLSGGNHTVQEGDGELFLTSDERRLLETYRKLNGENKYHALITLMEMEVMQFKNQSKDDDTPPAQ